METGDKQNPTTGRSKIDVDKITPGMVIYAPPGPLIVPEVLTTQTLRQQQKDKHPLIVLAVDAGAQQITVTYIASFSKAANLASVPKVLDDAKKLFVPITPAVKEYDLEPISWESHPEPIPAGWASIRSKMVLTGPQFVIFDNEKYFSAETAEKLNGLIVTVV